MKRSLFVAVFALFTLPALGADSIVIHSNVPFKANQAQTCGLLTGKPVFTDTKGTGKQEMYCANRTDFDPAGFKMRAGNTTNTYPYTRVSKISLLDDEATKMLKTDKWVVWLWCQDNQKGELQCSAQDQQ